MSLSLSPLGSEGNDNGAKFWRSYQYLKRSTSVQIPTGEELNFLVVSSHCQLSSLWSGGISQLARKPCMLWRNHIYGSIPKETRDLKLKCRDPIRSFASSIPQQSVFMKELYWRDSSALKVMTMDNVLKFLQFEMQTLQS